MLVHGESHKENFDVNDISTSSMVDGGDTTDISMTESISFDTCSFNEEIHSLTSGASSKEVSPDHRSNTLPSKLEGKNAERDEIDELLQVERNVDNNEKLYQTMPSPLPSQSSTEKDLSFESNVACASLSQQQHLTSTETSPEASSKMETEYKSAEITLSTPDESTLTNKSTDDEYLTPMNTLKPVDFDDFKRQMRQEFIQNTSLLQSGTDDTLKSRQPIDPSRINDSLKLYGDQNIMSKSFSGEPALRVVPTSIQYQTLNNSKSESSNSNHSNYALKKSGSAAISPSDISSSSENGIINRSKSGPNWYRNHNIHNDDDDDSDDGTATLKPSTIKKRSINIKMDCYDEIGNGVSSTTSGASTTLTTPTSPHNEEYLVYNPLNDDDLEDEIDLNEGVVVLRKPKAGSTAIKRRSGNKRYFNFFSTNKMNIFS